MFLVASPKIAMHDALLNFHFIDRKPQCTIFLSTEKKEIHTKTMPLVGALFANNLETDLNV